MRKITLLFILMLTTTFSFAQETCSGAFPITAAGTFVVDAINGTQAIPAICSTGSGLGTAAEWYAYTPTQNYSTTVTTDLAVNICKDTRLQIYTGTCGSLTCLAGDDDSGIISCNSGNTNSYLSSKTFNVTAGTTYYIAFDNKWNSFGFTFQVIENPVTVIPTGPVTFTNQTLSSINGAYNMCVVDMNNDYLDDIVSVSPGNLRINYQNAITGEFTAVDFPNSGATMMPGWSMAAGDYNKDGYNDLVLGNGQGISLLKSNNLGTGYTGITPGEYIFCQRTNFADLNSDGNLDVFSCHDVDDNVYYLNDGTNLTYYQSNTTPGAMNLSAGGGNYSTLFTDFDNDNDTDMFISKCSGPPCQLFRNDGNGVYTNISAIAGINVPAQTWSSAIADFDNDGDMDIIITASSGTHKYFRNNLDTTNTTEEAYTNITVGSGWDTNTDNNIDNIAYDFDNNGFVDVLGGGNKIMYNQGNGTFLPFAHGFGVSAVGDLNNDGFLDLQSGTTLRINSGNSNNWIKLNLQGIQSNSNGIGARVEIYGAFGKKIRDVRSGEGFEFMSSLNVHFGIGTATAITQVVIKWPSGLIDTIDNPAINQSLFVVEGATLAVSDFTNAGFSLYPNPAQKIINIKTDDSVTLKLAQVYDLNGKLALESKLENNSIDVEKLTTGTYILLLRDENNKDYSKKFIKE